MELQLPDVIIVYGPPLAGKGTQGDYLRKLLPEFLHLDFGTELRRFVAEHIQQSETKNGVIANRMDIAMKQGSAVLTEDLRFVVEYSITSAVTSGKKLIIEGPGRLVAEAEWLSKYLGSLELSVAIFHLHIGLEEVLRRAQYRWYCPGNPLPFIGHQAAKDACQGTDHKPYQRPEDLDPAINMKRYEQLYNVQYAEILQIYQLNCDTTVYTLDAHKKITDVSSNILLYLQKYYNFK
jgi:adenylate kinase family enzyme